MVSSGYLDKDRFDIFVHNSMTFQDKQSNSRALQYCTRLSDSRIPISAIGLPPNQDEDHSLFTSKGRAGKKSITP